jgi:hypothetical protein
MTPNNIFLSKFNVGLKKTKKIYVCFKTVDEAANRKLLTTAIKVRELRI